MISLKICKSEKEVIKSDMFCIFNNLDKMYEYKYEYNPRRKEFIIELYQSCTGRLEYIEKLIQILKKKNLDL